MSEPTSSTDNNMPVELGGVPDIQRPAPTAAPEGNEPGPGSQQPNQFSLTKEEWDRVNKELTDTKASLTQVSQEASYWQNFAQQMQPAINQPVSSQQGASDDVLYDPEKRQAYMENVAINAYMKMEQAKKANKFKSDFESYRRENPQEAVEMMPYIQKAYATKTPYELASLESHDDAVQKLISEAKDIRKREIDKTAKEILGVIANDLGINNANNPPAAVGIAATTNFGKPSGGPPVNQNQDSWFDDIVKSGPKSAM